MDPSTASAPSPTPAAPRALLFGGSGQIGERLIARLLAAGWQVHALSRQPRADAGALHWWQGDLGKQPVPPAGAFAAVFSCGPLDHFARWYAQGGPPGARVVAFGSTSLQVKQASADAGERALAQRLADAEATLYAAAATRGAAATVLRPTLVYGAGRDLTLTRIAALAARTGFFVLPADACGQRQPVHVDDLAAAALAVAAAPATAGRSYALGGGEVLAYAEMVRRVLLAGAGGARLLQVPTPLFAATLRLAHALGRLRGMNAAALQRMREDLVFDLGPAARDFGYAPRRFAPTALELGIGAG